jgi:hypothetical protein
MSSSFPNCDPTKPLVEGLPTERFEWTEKTTTRLAKIAADRVEAQKALNMLHAPIDPIAKKQRDVAIAAQGYWERIVMETGQLTFLSPTKTANVSQWISTWLGRKVALAGDVRESLLNAKRLTDGFVREAGVYAMLGKQRQLAKLLKSTAKKRGATVSPEDMRRILEEGMIPQRLAVYGNSPTQNAVLMDSYNRFVEDFKGRGFLDEDIPELLNKAQEVSSQWDELMAIQQATGESVSNLYNLGYMPRQLTADGFASAKLAGAIDLENAADMGAALAKSRSTWQYLPEDHNLTAIMLGIHPDELHGLIANPVDFAQFLSNRVSTAQLDLLVDSGIMSKVPMLTSEVAELITRTYKLPLNTTELFIADPLEATQALSKSLNRGLEQSSMVKLIETEGLSKGWSVPKELVEADPAQYANFRPISEVKGLAPGVLNKGTYVHPVVFDQLSAIVDIAKAPSEMNNVGRAWQVYTQWFSKQAIGNPIGAKVYLANQFLSNLLSAYGRGVGVHEYLASVIDMTKLAMGGLELFDNVKPFRVIDGKAVTHRELVAMTARMFSRDVLPGLSGADALLKFEELNPLFIAKQFIQLKAAAKTTPEYLTEVANVLGRKGDAIFLPTIRLASILDMAGHLSVVRGRSHIAGNAGQKIVDGVLQFGLGNSIGKFDTWQELTTEVKRGFPVFDDVGKIPSFISRVAPFSSWAIQNLPLQMRDMLRHPSRWYAYGRIHALWNDAQLEEGGDTPVVGEFQQAELNEYGIVLRRDAHDKKTYMLMTNNFDPRWGALTWLSNSIQGETKMSKLRGSTQGTTQDWINQAISKTYFNGLYEALSGVDTYTGIKRDDSDYNVNNQFAGISMPAWMSGVLSISPVLSSIDRLPAISGTKAVFDPRTNAVLVPAVQGWLGNQGKLSPSQLEGVEATIQTLGAKVRMIDGIRNMQYTEKDTTKAINDLLSKQRFEQQRLATDVRNGTVKEASPEYARRLDAVNRMTDAVIQLNFDLGRIQLWAIENKVPSTEMLREMNKRNLVMDDLPLPGADYIRESLDNAKQLKEGK